MTREKIIERFVRDGERLGAAAEAGVAPGRLADLAVFREWVQSNLDAFLQSLDAPLEERRRKLEAQKLGRLAVLEGTPDLFGPVDYTRAETLHTRVVAWVLSPERNGALGVAPLRAFLELLATKTTAEIRPEWADEAANLSANPEWSVGDLGRVDVWLQLPDAIFAIEAKVDHVERADQVADYRRALQNAPAQGARFTVFLTLVSQVVSSDSEAIHITFEDLLRAWLPVAAEGSSGEHQYLGAWLRTVAQRLTGTAGSGAFHTWPRAQRGRTLSLLEETS